MIDNVIFVAFDRTKPEFSKLSEDTPLTVTTDCNILTEIEVWARTVREVVEHSAKPLSPMTRNRALAMLSCIRTYK